MTPALPTLPDYNFLNEDTLQQSADFRASVALQAAESPVSFKGMQLRLTISIKSLFMMLRRYDGAQPGDDTRDERDGMLLLYLCSQDPAAYSEPVSFHGHTLQPLRARPEDWLVAIDEWLDATFTPREMTEAIAVVDHLWHLHHANQAVVDNDTPDAGAQKKTQQQPGKQTSSPRSKPSRAGTPRKSAKSSR